MSGEKSAFKQCEHPENFMFTDFLKMTVLFELRLQNLE